jgi:heat shock protein HslJ
MGVTQMACPDMSLEQEFLKTLKTVDAYEVDDASLVFKSGGTVVARFSK